MSKYTPKRNTQDKVVAKQEFTGSSMFGHWVHDHVYAVFSYVVPIYAYAAGEWFENADAYSFSRTTNGHMTIARPVPYEATRKLRTSDMRCLLDPTTDIGSAMRLLASIGETQ